MTAKATNDAVALIRSLAELRGRNADWAEKAVREAASLSANAALQANVIDLVARDQAELLRQIDGRTVEVAGGETRHLATREATLEAIEPGWISRFLRVITDPNVAFILLLVGIYGLIFEVSLARCGRARGDRHDLSAVGPLCPQHAAHQLCGPRADPVGHHASGHRSLQPDRGSRPRRGRRIRARSGDAVRARSARIPAVMAGDRRHGGDLRRPDPGCPRLASTCPKRPHTCSARKPCAACPPKSSTGPRAKATSSPTVSGGRRRGTEAFKPGEMVEVANIVDLTLVVRRRPVLTAREGGTT